jgi:hypothetical protein
MATSWIMVAALTAGVLLLVVVGMAVGVLFGRKGISGSCGGIANQRNADGSVSCGLCGNPSEECREKRQAVSSS